MHALMYLLRHGWYWLSSFQGEESQEMMEVMFQSQPQVTMATVSTDYQMYLITYIAQHVAA